MREELQRLTSAVAQAQAQVELSQRQITGLQGEIARLQSRLAGEAGGGANGSSGLAGEGKRDGADAGAKVADLQELRERQDLQQAEIATHEQAKVETESKYALKLTGLIVLNGFTNTEAVDVIGAPTLATGGVGSTGATLRQTVLGLEARGPHLFGARTHADVRVDFFGSGTQNSYGPSAGLLRLRTAHALLDWGRTQAMAEMDRPILSPNLPTSLTAIAEPALAWSGNLWTWAPQIALTHEFRVGERTHLKVQGAVIDVPDPPLLGVATNRNASLAEQSRWPGTEARLAWRRGEEERGAEVGFGGYFSPHRLSDTKGFDAWAGTMDYRLPLPARMELTGSLYRGQALGGLGGGAYKDYVYRVAGSYHATRVLSDVGGWTQMKLRWSERLQANAAAGLDNAFAGELRPYANEDAYQNLARNRTFFTNVIYSPTAATLFSVEYRRIDSAGVTGDRYSSNVIGIAAGYKF
ncbi:MAG: hypothetical protein NVSMB3_08620 [Acidobacteriaceae bacterium]